MSQNKYKVGDIVRFKILKPIEYSSNPNMPMVTAINEPDGSIWIILTAKIVNIIKGSEPTDTYVMFCPHENRDFYYVTENEILGYQTNAIQRIAEKLKGEGDA